MLRNVLINAVTKIVREQLAPATVTDVDIQEDLDHDGDEILRITIVFEVEGDRLESKKVLGLARHLREPLKKYGEQGFPVFSFLTPEEKSGAAA